VIVQKILAETLARAVFGHLWFTHAKVPARRLCGTAAPA